MRKNVTERTIVFAKRDDVSIYMMKKTLQGGQMNDNFSWNLLYYISYVNHEFLFPTLTLVSGVAESLDELLDDGGGTDSPLGLQLFSATTSVEEVINDSLKWSWRMGGGD